MNNNALANIVPVKFKKNGNPSSVNADVVVFGETVRALVHFRDVSTSFLAPKVWKADEDVSFRQPVLVKLLKKLGDKVRVRHTSAFSGMTDGSEPVPADRQAWTMEQFLAFLVDENRSGGLCIYYSSSSRSVRVSTYCDSFTLEDRAEADRRAVLSAQLPALAESEHVNNRVATKSRERFLASRLPGEFDDAIEALMGITDPVAVLAIVDPVWLAALQKRAA